MKFRGLLAFAVILALVLPVVGNIPLKWTPNVVYATSPTLDGTAVDAITNDENTFATIQLAVPSANTLIVLDTVIGNGKYVTGVSDNRSLTWTKRGTVSDSTTINLTRFYAIAATAGAVNITVTASGTYSQLKLGAWAVASGEFSGSEVTGASDSATWISAEITTTEDTIMLATGSNSNSEGDTEWISPFVRRNGISYIYCLSMASYSAASGTYTANFTKPYGAASPTVILVDGIKSGATPTYVHVVYSNDGHGYFNDTTRDILLGTEVTIFATPNTGYNWRVAVDSVDGNNTDNPYTYIADSNRTITAYFNANGGIPTQKEVLTWVGYNQSTLNLTTFLMSLNLTGVVLVWYNHTAEDHEYFDALGLKVYTFVGADVGPWPGGGCTIEPGFTNRLSGETQAQMEADILDALACSDTGNLYIDDAQLINAVNASQFAHFLNAVRNVQTRDPVTNKSNVIASANLFDWSAFDFTAIDWDYYIAGTIPQNYTTLGYTAHNASSLGGMIWAGNNVTYWDAVTQQQILDQYASLEAIGVLRISVWAGYYAAYGGTSMSLLYNANSTVWGWVNASDTAFLGEEIPLVYHHVIFTASAGGSVNQTAVDVLTGDSVTVLATANGGYTFWHFTNESVEVSTDNPFTFTPSVNQTINAVFNLTAGSQGIGIVYSTHDGSTIIGTLTVTYLQGGVTKTGTVTNLTTIFTMDNGSTWNITSSVLVGLTVGWFATTYSYVVAGDANVTVPYLHKFWLYISASPMLGGTISYLSGWYPNGSIYSYIATANPGYILEGWYTNGTLVFGFNPFVYANAGPTVITAKFVSTEEKLVWPITWVLFGIWLILLFGFKRYELIFMAGIFGIMLAYQTFGGEYWLLEDNTGVLRAVQFSTIFSMPLALFEVGVSTIIMFRVLWVTMTARREPKR